MDARGDWGRDGNGEVSDGVPESCRLMRAILAICLAFVAPITAQQNPAARAARQWRETHERAILGELAGFLSIPNLADDQGNLRRSADAAGDMLESRGVKVQMLQAAGS